MNTKLRAQLKAWDREVRNKTVQQMLAATAVGDVAKTQRLLDTQPLIEWFVPCQAQSWAELAAAAGQAELVRFWLARDAAAKKKPVSNDDLLFWTMGYEYMSHDKGDAVALATDLLDRGANIDGKPNTNYTPLHRAAARNRPELVALLIRRGADLSRPCRTGRTALMIARMQPDGECAKLLKQAGAPMQVPFTPKPPPRPKTIDLRRSAEKLKAGLAKAVQRFVRQHSNEALTAIALASIPHEGYVMVSFDTGKFEGSPWDAAHDGFAWIKFPDWLRAHEADTMSLIDLDGRSRSGNVDRFQRNFLNMIVQVLKELELEGAFSTLTRAKGCQVGIEMTGMGEGKFWKLRGK